MDGETAVRQLLRVPTGAAPHVEDAVRGVEAERGDDVVDLLHRALGVGVPVVGGAEVVGEILEPVVAVDHRRSSRQLSGVAASGASQARPSS